MKLIPIKLSELNENEKYHVYDDNAHTYFSSHFDAKKSIYYRNCKFTLCRRTLTL